MSNTPSQKLVDRWVEDYDQLDIEGAQRVLEFVANHYMDDNMVVRRGAGMLLQRRPDLTGAITLFLTQNGMGGPITPE